MDIVNHQLGSESQDDFDYAVILSFKIVGDGTGSSAKVSAKVCEEKELRGEHVRSINHPLLILIMPEFPSHVTVIVTICSLVTKILLILELK